MNKNQNLLILFSLIFLNYLVLKTDTQIDSNIELAEEFTEILKNPDEIKKDTRDWLIFVYIAANNNLKNAALKDIERLRLGSNDKAHVLVSLHTKRDGKRVSERMVIQNKKINFDGKIPVVDSGRPETLEAELKWALGYQAKNIMVVLWGHGTGALNKSEYNPLRAVCGDDDTGNKLTDADIKKTFESVLKLYNKKIDLLAFDACLMAGVEVGYAVRNCANFMIAAETSLPGEAISYTEILKLIETEKLTPLNLARSIIKIYRKNFNENTKFYSVSAIDLSKMWDLSKNVSMSCNMLKLLEEKSTENVSTIKKVARESLRFGDSDYVDLGDFYTNLQNSLYYNQSLKPNQKDILDALMEEVQNVLQKAVIESALSATYKKASGLTIYFPLSRPYHDSYDDSVWAKENLWPYFLKHHITLSTTPYII